MADPCGYNQGPGILDRIKDRLAQVGCGSGCGAPAPAPCGCIEPVVESCGCDVAPSCGGGGLGLLDKLKGRLSSMGSGCGCAAPAADCGCNVAPVIAEPCGCDAPAPACGRVGLLDNLKGRFSSIGNGCGCAAPAADCGCEPAPAPCAPAPRVIFTPVATPCAAPVADCGCDAAPACGGGGLLDRLKGRMSSMGGGGCGCAAPVADDCGCAPAPAPCVVPAMPTPCGCDAAPVADCGCNGGGRIKGAFSQVRGGLLQGRRSACGCEVAAPVADCGCNAAPACGCESSCGSAGRGRLSLLDRLRGNRIPRDRTGRVLGGGCNDGCNSPCPSSGCDTGCGCASAMTPVSGCSSCGGGEVMYSAPAAGAVYSNSSIMETAPVISTEPAAAPASEDVIEAAPAAEGNTPAVDPNAFIIRNGNVRG